jgi:hypothetical protein
MRTAYCPRGHSRAEFGIERWERASPYPRLECRACLREARQAKRQTPEYRAQHREYMRLRRAGQAPQTKFPLSPQEKASAEQAWLARKAAPKPNRSHHEPRPRQVEVVGPRLAKRRLSPNELRTLELWRERSA